MRTADGHPDDDLAVYALDALGGAPRRAVERHLAHCPTCRCELAAHRETLSRLTAAAEPPPGLWGRIVATTGPARPSTS
jgi:anti-sigma factor RsiW